jgi:4-oxalocrotonate tautomerase
VIPALDRQGFFDYNIQGFVGHGTGLSITERPILNPLEELILEPGMVIDVEPGIYLRNQEVGLRTAQFVAVTDDGSKLLTKPSAETGNFVIELQKKEEKKMPIVQIELIGEKTLDEKRVLVEKVTKAIAEALNYPPEIVSIIIRKMERDDFSVGGELFADKYPKK